MKSFLDQSSGTVDDLRAMVGMASKYILPRTDWDYRQPVILIDRLGFSSQTHPIVNRIMEGFSSIDSTGMLETNPLTALLQDMARYDRTLKNRPSRKQRKKRLGRFRREMVHILSTLRVLADLPADAASGVHYSVICIRRQFLK